MLCPDNAKASFNEPRRCGCVAGFYDALFGADLLLPRCLPCPTGGTCDSGFVAAAEGYWRETTRSALFFKCREGKCVAENVTGPFSADWSAAQSLAALAPVNGSAGVNGSEPANCVEGSTGPLCALCLPGDAVQSGECAPCDPADAWPNWSAGAQAGLLVGCLVFASAFLAFAFFQPVAPALERAAAAAIASFRACFGRAKQCATCGIVRYQPEAAEAEKQPAEQPYVKAHDMAEHAGADVSLAAPAEDAAKAHAHGEQHAKDAKSRSALAEARDAHDRQALASAVASAAGAAAAMAALDAMDVGSGDANVVLDSDSGGGSEDEGIVDMDLDFLGMLDELTDKVKKYAKILVNFFQIVSTFLHSLDIPWCARPALPGCGHASLITSHYAGLTASERCSRA